MAEEDLIEKLAPYGVYFTDDGEPIVHLSGNKIAVILDPVYQTDGNGKDDHKYTSILLTGNPDGTENLMLVYGYGLLELLAQDQELIVEAGRARLMNLKKQADAENMKALAKSIPSTKKPRKKKGAVEKID